MNGTRGSAHGDECSDTHENTERMIGAGVPFQRVRRITGYLVGGLGRFNDAKRAEERDRVKHGVNA